MNTPLGKLHISRTRDRYRYHYPRALSEVMATLFAVAIAATVAGVVFRTPWLIWALLVPTSLLILWRWWQIRFGKDYYSESAQSHTERLRKERPTLSPEPVCLARWLLIQKLKNAVEPEELLINYDVLVYHQQTVLWTRSPGSQLNEWGTLMVRTTDWIRSNRTDALKLSAQPPSDLAKWLQVNLEDNQFVPALPHKH